MLRIKLKPDILIKEVEGVYILKNKGAKKNSYVKVSPDYLPLILRIQAGIDVEELFNQDKDKGALIQFINALAQLNLLEGQRPPFQRVSPFLIRLKTFLFSLLAIKLFQFDPDRFISWLYLKFKLRFFYRLYFLIPAFAFSIIMLAILFCNNFFSFSYSLPPQRAVFSLLFYLFLSLGMFVHELAHGVTCKHWGGEVKRLGFMLYYLVPAAFSDISDSYLFNKFRRISVLIAGPLTSIFIGLWLGGIWLFTERGSFVNLLFYSLAWLSIFAPLFSLNPLLKFDGYYLLTEFLGMENLRGRSYIYLTSLFKKLSSKDTRPSLEFRLQERLIYLLYGGISIIFSVAFLLFIINRLVKMVWV